MIREGWAIAYLKYSSAYQKVEEDARVHQRGLWQGAFIAPWDWRHKNNMTVILGALQVPINAQALLSFRDRRCPFTKLYDQGKHKPRW
jgi:hypothetical protein